MLGVWSGFTEEQIDNFSYKFYKNCIKDLSIKFQFESYKGIAGNSYAENVSDTLNSINPITQHEKVKPQKPQRMTKEMAMKFMGANNKQ